jgi:hypothetical protein
MGFTRTAAQYINKSKSMLDKVTDIPEKYKVDWLLATTCYLYEVGQISNTDELEKIEKSTARRSDQRPSISYWLSPSLF